VDLKAVDFDLVRPLRSRRRYFRPLWNHWGNQGDFMKHACYMDAWAIWSSALSNQTRRQT